MNANVQKTAAYFSNALIYGLYGIYHIMPIFLSKYFNSIEAGFLLAIYPFVLCISPLFWGGITDKAKNQNLILVLFALVSATILMFLKINTSFIAVACIMIFYAFFQSPSASLLDVLTIRTSEKFKTNYGAYRIMGTIGFAIVVYLITLLPDADDFVYVYMLVAILGCISVFMMTRVRGTKSNKSNEKGSIKTVIKNKELWLLIAILGCGFFTWGYYSNFFPTYITNTLELDSSIWGVVAFISAFSEVPFFIYYSKIYKMISIKTISTLSCFAMLVRWIVFATVKDIVLLIIVSFVTGMFITVLTYCVTVYIVSAIAPQLINRAQSLMYAVGTGLPKVLAGCVGGYMTTYLGETKSFAVCAVISLIGLALGLIFSKTMDSIDEKVRKYR